MASFPLHKYWYLPESIYFLIHSNSHSNAVIVAWGRTLEITS